MSAPLSEARGMPHGAADKAVSWYEASARQRVQLLLDAGSFKEFIGPSHAAADG